MKPVSMCSHGNICTNNKCQFRIIEKSPLNQLNWFRKLPAQWQLLCWFAHFVESRFVSNCVSIGRCDSIRALAAFRMSVHIIVMTDFGHFYHFNSFIVLHSMPVFWIIRWKTCIFRKCILIRFAVIEIIVWIFHQRIFGIVQHSQFHEHIFNVLTLEIIKISGALAEF